MTSEQLAKIRQDLEDEWPGDGWEKTIRELLAEIERLKIEKDAAFDEGYVCGGNNAGH